MRLPVQLVESFDDCQLDFEVLQGDSSWSVPALLHSWANYGSGYETAAYLKDGLGFVHLKGVIESGSSGTVAFILPPGYRPGATTDHPLGNNAYAGAAQIDVSGNVTIVYTSASVWGLSGITFLAEN